MKRIATLTMALQDVGDVEALDPRLVADASAESSSGKERSRRGIRAGVSTSFRLNASTRTDRATFAAAQATPTEAAEPSGVWEHLAGMLGTPRLAYYPPYEPPFDDGVSNEPTIGTGLGHVDGPRFGGFAAVPTPAPAQPVVIPTPEIDPVLGVEPIAVEEPPAPEVEPIAEVEPILEAEPMPEPEPLPEPEPVDEAFGGDDDDLDFGA